MADHRNDGLSASGSVQARSESGDVATSPSAGSEQVQGVSSVVLVAEGVGAMSGRATDIYGTPSGTSSEGEGVPEEELVTEGQFEDEEDENGGSGESNNSGLGGGGGRSRSGSDGSRYGSRSVWNFPMSWDAQSERKMTPSPLRPSKLLGGLPTDRVNVRRRTESRLREMESTIHGMEDRVDKVDGAVQTNRFDRVEQLLGCWDQKFDESVSEFLGSLKERLSKVGNHIL